jgi:hypothetical protein
MLIGLLVLLTGCAITAAGRTKLHFESEPTGASVLFKAGLNRNWAENCVTPCDVEFRRTTLPAYVEFRYPGRKPYRLLIEPSLSITQKIPLYTGGAITAGTLGWLVPFGVLGIVTSEIQNASYWPDYVMVTLPELESPCEPQIRCAEPWEVISGRTHERIYGDDVLVDGRCKVKGGE